MIKRIQLVFILGFILHTSKAQQVFECPEFGFKFVISYEFDGYNGNSIPLITYVAKGSPAEIGGMIAGANLTYITGSPIFYGKNVSGEDVLNCIKNLPYECCMTLYTTKGWGQSGELYVNMVSGGKITFPEAKQATVAGGKNLLGTCVEGCKEDVKTILYENGDIYKGEVVKQIYPDPKYIGGRYITLAEYIKPLKEKHAAKEAEYAAIKQQQEDEKRKAAELLKERQAAAIIKYRQDSINNFKSLNEFIEMIYPDVAKRPMIYGIGIDIKKDKGAWIVSEVKPASSAWFFGIMEGDVLTNVNGTPAAYLSKMNIVTGALLGNPWEEKIIEISRPADNISLQKVFAKCYTVYHRPASFTQGCISGDCENGDGIYLDQKGIMYNGGFINGKFNNHLVSKNGGEVVNAAEKMYTYSNFTNGIKNGYTIIYSDRGKIMSLSNAGGSYGSSGIFTVGYGGEFINDVPHGKGVLTRGLADGYNVKYESGVLKGRALKIKDENNYTYCDVSPRFEPINCNDYTGTPPDDTMIPLSTPGTVIDEPDNVPQVLLLVSNQIISKPGPGETYSGSSLERFDYSQFGKKYIRIPVPSGNEILFNVLLLNAEMEKAIIGCYVAVRDGEVDTNVKFNSGPMPPNGAVYYRGWAYYNTSPGQVELVVELEVKPASMFNSRTICWFYSLTK